MAIAWIDTETTGLNVQTHEVLEVACIVTDDQLNEVARYQRVVYSPYAADILDMHRNGMDAKAIAQCSGGRLHPEVVEMHLTNGLLAECITGAALDAADREFAKVLEQYAMTPLINNPERMLAPQLAGSSVWFDRGFLVRHMPRTAGQLHYREIDVSSFNETARRFWPDVYTRRPKKGPAAHRAMPDIEESIAVYRHYLRELTPAGHPIVAMQAPPATLSWARDVPMPEHPVQRPE